MANLGQTLEPDQWYGRLPFDQFALAHWDHDARITDGQSRWDQLIKDWLAMDIAQREPYRKAASQVTPSQLPTQEEITRVLEPFQTASERNLEGLFTRSYCLRTCYAPELADVAEDMMSKMVDLSENVLNNEELYNFESDWSRILWRLPSICDRIWAPDDLDLASAPTDAAQRLLWEADNAAIVLLCLLDRQALEENLITILWLDCHGEAVWWNKIDPENTLYLSGFLEVGMNVGELVSLGDGYENFMEKGALMEWIS